MSTIHLTKESHTNPSKFRIEHNDAMGVLGPKVDFKIDKQKPVLSSSSKITMIGGGFAGVTASLMCKHKLKTDDFVVFDKHSEWGGTWWANTYPGCASDIPALWYLIFSELTDNWSDLRPPQFEMEEYILSVVKKNDLNKHTRFETAVQKCEYDDVNQEWKILAINVKSGQQYHHTTKILISCSGGLVYPSQLEAPGLKTRFKGKYMHSALYDHSVNVEGKKVVVVGNGCSAAQLVPAMMDLNAASVTQVFRSKHWIMPPVPQALFWLYKLLSGFRWGLVFVRWFTAIVAEMRYPLYQGNGMVARILRALSQWSCRRYVRKYAPEKYHDMLIPNYKLGCKRLIFDYKYIPSTANPKFDLKSLKIKEVTENEVILEDGTRIEADIIVACTGYNLHTSLYSPYKLVGRNGVSITEQWAKEGPGAYKTFMVRDCPNFFFVGGPNSATGHSSVVSAIENGCAFISKLAPDILNGKVKTVEVKRSAYYEWFEKTQARLKKGVFGSKFGGCVSWYTENGINATTYPYSQVHYFITSRHFSRDAFIYDGDKKEI